MWGVTLRTLAGSLATSRSMGSYVGLNRPVPTAYLATVRSGHHPSWSIHLYYLIKKMGIICIVKVPLMAADGIILTANVLWTHLAVQAMSRSCHGRLLVGSNMPHQSAVRRPLSPARSSEHTYFMSNMLTCILIEFLWNVNIYYIMIFICGKMYCI